MDNFQKDIDDRVNLILFNCFELLLFCFGILLYEQKLELFGINVFKLCEIVLMFVFMCLVGMKVLLLGMVNIWDQVILVIDLLVVVGCKLEIGLNILLIIEYVCSVQVFVVELVENIMCFDW